MLFVDIDHFKRVNDTYGHAAGDRVLVEVAGVLRSVIGRRGAAYRYGGEELVVLLPDVDVAEAAATAERIRVAIAVLKFNGMPSITASIGVAVAGGGTAFADTKELADKAVYRAKDGGRNRVEVWSQDPVAQQ